MGYRLSKIYTKTGDNKTTATATNQRLTKDHPKIILNGQLDELNSWLGVIRSTLTVNQKKVDSLLLNIQNQLFDFGGEITLPSYQKINQESVSYLEDAIDEINQLLSPLKEFILPGGNQSASFCHLTRAVARKAECSLITLSRSESLNQYLFSYLNRLSDLLFVIARYLNLLEQTEEVYWKSKKLIDKNS